LLELRDTCLYYLTHFTDPANYQNQYEYPSNAFGYLNIATDLIHRLPTWNTQDHNRETKHDPYQRLALAWIYVSREIGKRATEEGKVYALSFVSEWERHLQSHSDQVKGRFGFNEALLEFRSQFGWILNPYANY
jgi:protein Cut8